MPRSFVLSLAMASAAMAAVVGCAGTEPVPQETADGVVSPEAYCRAFYEAAVKLNERVADLEDRDDVVTTVLFAVTTPAQVSRVFDEMVPVAPEDIAGDTAAIRDALNDMQDTVIDNVDDPAAAGLAALIAGAAANESFVAVNEYLSQHCPTDSELAQEYLSQLPAEEPSDEVVEAEKQSLAAVGAVILDLTGPGAYSVLSSRVGMGYTIRHALLQAGVNESDFSTYDAAGNLLYQSEPGVFESQCLEADYPGLAEGATADGQRTVYGYSNVRTPAEGINAATQTDVLHAWDAETGDERWTVELPADGVEGGCSLAVSADGTWLLWNNRVISTEDGTMLREVGAVNVLGSWLAQSQPSLSLKIMDPRSGASLGKVEGLDVRAWGGGYAVSNGTAGAMHGAGPGTELPMLSEDGTTLFGHDVDTGVLTAWALPSGDKKWRSNLVPEDDFLNRYTNANGLFFGNGGDVYHGDGRLMAIDQETGKVRWSAPQANPCGATATQVFVAANGQFAVLDANAGGQESFTEEYAGIAGDADNSCLDFLGGGVFVGEKEITPGTSDHGLGLAQALTP